MTTFDYIVFVLMILGMAAMLGWLAYVIITWVAEAILRRRARRDAERQRIIAAAERSLKLEEEIRHPIHRSFVPYKPYTPQMSYVPIDQLDNIVNMQTEVIESSPNPNSAWLGFGDGDSDGGGATSDWGGASSDSGCSTDSSSSCDSSLSSSDF